VRDDGTGGGATVRGGSDGGAFLGGGGGAEGCGADGGELDGDIADAAADATGGTASDVLGGGGVEVDA
jgi:hypothetical protein